MLLFHNLPVTSLRVYLMVSALACSRLRRSPEGGCVWKMRTPHLPYTPSLPCAAEPRANLAREGEEAENQTRSEKPGIDTPALVHKVLENKSCLRASIRGNVAGCQ